MDVSDGVAFEEFFYELWLSDVVDEVILVGAYAVYDNNKYYLDNNINNKFIPRKKVKVTDFYPFYEKPEAYCSKKSEKGKNIDEAIDGFFQFVTNEENVLGNDVNAEDIGIGDVFLF